MDDEPLMTEAEQIFDNVLDAILEVRKLESSDGCVVVMRADGAVIGKQPIERRSFDNYLTRGVTLSQTIATVMADERIIFETPARDKMREDFLQVCRESRMKVGEDERGCLTIPKLQF